jgi:hypothetical protein
MISLRIKSPDWGGFFMAMVIVPLMLMKVFQPQSEHFWFAPTNCVRIFWPEAAREFSGLAVREAGSERIGSAVMAL